MQMFRPLPGSRGSNRSGHRWDLDRHHHAFSRDIACLDPAKLRRLLKFFSVREHGAVQSELCDAGFLGEPVVILRVAFIGGHKLGGTLNVAAAKVTIIVRRGVKDVTPAMSGAIEMGVKWLKQLIVWCPTCDVVVGMVAGDGVAACSGRQEDVT